MRPCIEDTDCQLHEWGEWSDAQCEADGLTCPGRVSNVLGRIAAAIALESERGRQSVTEVGHFPLQLQGKMQEFAQESFHIPLCHWKGQALRTCCPQG